MTCAAIANPHPPALRDTGTVATAAALPMTQEAADLPAAKRGTRVLAGLVSHWDAARAIMDA